MTDTAHYRQLLISLQIEEKWIPDALSEEQCQALYFKLKLFTPGFIRERWQLNAVLWHPLFYPRVNRQDHVGNSMGHYAALAGNCKALDDIRSTQPSILEKMNKVGNTIAHYAAMSGSLVVLDWIKKHDPALLTQTNHQDYNIAHFAAKGGHVHVLEWIKHHAPDLLTQHSKAGSTFTHPAALAGHIDVLEWIKKNYPHQLKATNHEGDTLAHCAAASDNPAALPWFKRHCPELIAAKNHNGYTIVHFAALSAHAEQFNLALTWTGNPAQFNLTTLSAGQLKQQSFLSMLETALQTNYALTELTLPPGITLFPRLEELLAENKKVRDVLKTYTYFCHAKNKGIGCLPKDILLGLFTTSMNEVSNRLPSALIKALFDKIHNGGKANRIPAALAIENRITRLKGQLDASNFFSRINAFRRIDTLAILEKIDALTALKQRVLCSNHFTEDIFRDWYQAHAKVINRQEYGLLGFFEASEAANHLIPYLCRLFAFEKRNILAAAGSDQKAIPDAQGPPR